MGLFLTRKSIALVLVLLAWPGLVHANIGDTLAELRGRYGSAKDMGGQMLFEVRLAHGQIVPASGAADTENHFTINVYFDGGRSAMEVFTRNTSDPVKGNLSQADIDTILNATSGGLDWQPVQVANGKPTWVLNGKKIIARFSPNQGGKADGASVLIIMVNDQ